MAKSSSSSESTSCQRPTSTATTSTSNVDSPDFLSSISPTQVLLSSSIPLLAGTYFGYIRALRRGDVTAHDEGCSLFENMMLVNKSNSRMPTATVETISGSMEASIRREARKTKTIEPAFLAIKALSLGTMLSIGGVGLLSAGAFYVSGCRSMQELIDSWKTWTPQMRIKVENFFGISAHARNTCYHQDVDVKAVAGMTEDEEIEYYKRKYIPELYENENTDTGKSS